MSAGTFGVIGCAVLFLLPASLLNDWISGRLTWTSALTAVVACTLVLAVPLIFAGRNDAGG